MEVGTAGRESWAGGAGKLTLSHLVAPNGVEMGLLLCDARGVQSACEAAPLLILYFTARVCAPRDKLGRHLRCM